MSIAQENGFISISINYINKLYALVVLQYIFADCNTNGFIDVKVSYEDAVMGISVFSRSGNFFFLKRIFNSNMVTCYVGL